ncbi:sugar ABC transporter ATP-binding protein [Bacillus sp. FJAT-29790]|uniref:sugar ABC transporter ATP-binding protein n=1 Tax=Bacillus sp. FJAT-29790 TaxID=1895002 RepID=UPI001C2376E5|nr:sugar ABC transporter ATP-binding protein [Bacillus sp. FJAT-29790]MBU8877514.1 sugar ABC transporter ATP-binding protein [Bacillus sp. FJAT-29790]
MANIVFQSDNSIGTSAINITNLIKRYGNFYANNNINLEINKGEVHALVGQNGAGKSTLLGILSGRIAPTSGSVHVFGKELHYGDPRSSRHSGIATIYQELTIIPNLMAVENVFLGQTISRYGFLSKEKMYSKFNEISQIMGVDIPPSILASRLSIADQQILEIMRGIQSNAKIILLDEPTASLAPPERESLLNTIKSLRSKGITIIYVSHNLEEVIDISDKITVFRDGEKVITMPKDFWTKEKLVANMLGQENVNEYLKFDKDENRDVLKDRKEIISCRNVTVPGIIESINLNVSSGEIVGIGGLVGSGRSTFVRALAGLEPSSSGQLVIGGKKEKWPTSPRMSIKYGIAFAPEDRKGQGLVLGLSARENINMVNFKQVSKWGFYLNKSASNIAQDFSEQFGLTRSIKLECRNLSGGNQQKVLLSKVCNIKPKVLIVDEPTRGIDLGVKKDVIKILRELASQGMGIIVISSELEEVVAVSDKVIVFSKGRMVKELNSKEEISVSNILKSTF